MLTRRNRTRKIRASRKRVTFGSLRRMGRKGRGKRVTARTGISKAVGRPPRFLVKLPYTTPLSFNTNLGQHLFNLNSLFDPDRTGTGHQPLGFDEWKAMGYTKYRVYGCAYDVSIVNTGSGAPLRATVAPQNSDATLQGTEADWEQPGAFNTKIVEYGSGSKRWKGYVKIPALLGYTNEQFRTSVYTEAIVGANPSELACLNIIYGALAGSGSVVGQIQVRLMYFAEIFDPAPLTIS